MGCMDLGVGIFRLLKIQLNKKIIGASYILTVPVKMTPIR